MIYFNDNLFIFYKYNLLIILKLKKQIKNFIMGIGDWGLGIGDWGLGPIPNPQSPIPHPQTPIPNPQSPIPNPHVLILYYFNNILKLY